ATVIVTEQPTVPLQTPLQPAKVEPAAGAAGKVTTVPPENEAKHVAPQEIPAGVLVTVPVPDLVTVRVNVCCAKVAVTERAALIVMVQVPVPVQAPLQAVKVEPAAAAAVRLTMVPFVNEAEHVAPQEIPAGVLVTVPVPMPDLVTVRVSVCCAKVAVTERAALIVTVQV